MSLDLNGTTQYLTVPTATAFNLTEGSISFMAAPDFAATTTTERAFIDVQTVRCFLYKSTSSGGMNLYIDGRERFFTGVTWVVGTLTHFLINYKKATDTIELYVNGVLQSSSSISGTWGSTAAGTSLSFGVDSTLAARFFDGDMGEVVTYNRILSAAEITALAAGISALLIAPESRLGYWRLISDGRPYWGINPITVVNAPSATVQPRIFTPPNPSFGQRHYFPPPRALPLHLVQTPPRMNLGQVLQTRRQAIGRDDPPQFKAQRMRLVMDYTALHPAVKWVIQPKFIRPMTGRDDPPQYLAQRMQLVSDRSRFRRATHWVYQPRQIKTLSRTQPPPPPDPFAGRVKLRMVRGDPRKNPNRDP